MKKLFTLIAFFLLTTVRADEASSRIVEEYKVGNKTYCLVESELKFYSLVEKEMYLAKERFWTSPEFLKYKDNTHRNIGDHYKVVLSGLSSNEVLEKLIRSVYTDEEIALYASATGDSVASIYLLCDYAGKIVSISISVGYGSLESLNPCARNVEKFARLAEEIGKRWSVELFYRNPPEACYQLFMRDIFHFKLFPAWMYQSFDQRPAMFQLSELQ